MPIEKENKYIDCGDYYKGLTARRHNEFYFDKEDYDLVSKYYWKLDGAKNVVTYLNNRKVTMHSMLFGQGTYKHIDGCKNNNRRKNIVSIRGYKNSGKIYLNGYIAIYMPEHKRAFKTNGCVYEHILIAERMLGRDLKNEECVHHIDYNRTNNSEDNLMIFLTNNDHVAYHGGANAIRLNDGTYMSDSIRFNYKYNNRTKKDIDNGVSDVGSITIIPKGYNLCPICKTNLKSNKANMCLECWNKEKLKNVPLKEELEKYIYNTSFVNIGKIFGVSDDTIRRWCKNRGLPYRRKDIEKIKVKGR